MKIVILSVLLVVLVLVLGAAVAHADGTTPMLGPDSTAFAARCEALRADAPTARCVRVTATRVGRFRVVVERVEVEATRRYYLALRIGGAWFVSPDPILVELDSHAAGHTYRSQIDDVQVRGAHLRGGGRAVAMQVRYTIRKSCGECDAPARRRVEQVLHRAPTLVCGVAAGGPACDPAP